LKKNAKKSEIFIISPENEREVMITDQFSGIEEGKSKTKCIYGSNVARMAHFGFFLLQKLAPMTSTRGAHRKQNWRR